MKAVFLASALALGCAAASATVPAAAQTLRYDLVGTEAGKWTASFTFDATRAASITLPDSVRYNGVPISFTRPGSTTVETASFSNTGPTFRTLNNQGGLFLGFLGGFPTQLQVFGPQLFDGSTTNPTFLTGTFGLSDIPRSRTTDPLQVNYRLTVSDISAVPEPATWSLLIVGMGLAGTALRRRRRVAHAA